MLSDVARQRKANGTALMKVEHSLRISCQCPVDQSTDCYELTVRVNRLLHVEDILAAVKENTKVAASQEEVTKKIAAALGVEVVTVGYHSGVKTTCTA